MDPSSAESAAYRILRDGRFSWLLHDAMKAHNEVEPPLVMMKKPPIAGAAAHGYGHEGR